VRRDLYLGRGECLSEVRCARYRDGLEVDQDQPLRGAIDHRHLPERFHVADRLRAHGDRRPADADCRYGARPPFSLERISLLPDGRVAYLRLSTAYQSEIPDCRSGCLTSGVRSCWLADT